jgi:uncharacterized protein YndB with AHSA1/START domain
MSETLTRSISHGSFTIERTFDGVTPMRVFEAFSTPQGKAAWFAAPQGEWEPLERIFDFRVGGRERLWGRWKSGDETDFDARYFDIVAGERIVYAYDMWHQGRKLSVSLATIEFKPAAGGTLFRMTEHGAFLDGYDDAGSRERGTIDLVGQLERYLAG